MMARFLFGFLAALTRSLTDGIEYRLSSSGPTLFLSKSCFMRSSSLMLIGVGSSSFFRAFIVSNCWKRIDSFVERFLISVLCRIAVDDSGGSDSETAASGFGSLSSFSSASSSSLSSYSSTVEFLLDCSLF